MRKRRSCGRQQETRGGLCVLLRTMTGPMPPPGPLLGIGVLMMVTRDGVAKKSDAASFKDVRRSGLIAIKLKGDDALIAAQFVGKGDEVSLITAGGQAIRFKEDDIREMGRAASGVRAMKLGKGDVIVSADVLKGGEKDRHKKVFHV